MAKPVSIEVWNPNGKYRVVSTKPMPGTRWINLLIEQDCRVEVVTLFHFFSPLSVSLLNSSRKLWSKFVLLLFFFKFQICTQKKTILSVEDIIALIGDKCNGVIGQVFYFPQSSNSFFFLMNGQKSYFGLLKFVIWVLSFSWQRTGERLCLLHWVEQEERLLVTWLLVTTMLTLMLLTNMVLLLETLL